MNILLVEDNPGDVTLFRQGLTLVNIPVHLSVVRDGEEALAFVFRREPYTQATSPDLIILDLNLPQKHGFDVLAALEHDAHLKFLPVVVFSSSSNPKEINRCYELGASAYLTKPITLDDYFALVKRTVEFWAGCKFRTLS